jgi:hypothetical protein
VHTFARLKFVYATDPDLKPIGLTLEPLGWLRNAASYQLGTPGTFVSPGTAASALADAGSADALLDALNAERMFGCGVSCTTKNLTVRVSSPTGTTSTQTDYALPCIVPIRLVLP